MLHQQLHVLCSRRYRCHLMIFPLYLIVLRHGRGGTLPCHLPCTPETGTTLTPPGLRLRNTLLPFQKVCSKINLCNIGVASSLTHARTMSTIARATSRIRRIPGSGPSSPVALSRTPILRRQPILPSTSIGSLPTSRSIITPSRASSRQLDQRRWSSSAAQAVEPEATVVEEVWPERILPTVSEKDAQRLKRQRNVGM
jgi:hypothetical protein